MTNYLDLLEFNYSQDCSDPNNAISRKTWILESLFDFFAYDSAMSDNLCDSLIKTIEAITQRKTFEFINQSPAQYRDYLIWCNTVLGGLIQWGSSIRGAWWDYGHNICINYYFKILAGPKTPVPTPANMGRGQISFQQKTVSKKLYFRDQESIIAFMTALVEFSRR